MSAPITTLTDDAEVVRRLHLLGIETAGELKQLTCDELVWQFGEEGRRLLEGVSVGEEALAKEEPLRGEWEIGGCGREALSYYVRTTFDEVIKGLAGRERGLRSVCLTFCFEEGDPAVFTLTFSRGAIDGAAVFASLESRLGIFAEEPAYACWEVVATFRVCARSLTLFPPPEEERRRRVAGVLEELKGRRAPKGLMEVVWDDPHSRLPERRAHLESLVKVGVTAPLCFPVLFRGKVGRILEEWEIAEEWWTASPIRRRYVRLPSYRRLFCDRLTGIWYAQ